MSLRNNIQGTKDERLEDANSAEAILKAAPYDVEPEPNYVVEIDLNPVVYPLVGPGQTITVWTSPLANGIEWNTAGSASADAVEIANALNTYTLIFSAIPNVDSAGLPAPGIITVTASYLAIFFNTSGWVVPPTIIPAAINNDPSRPLRAKTKILTKTKLTDKIIQITIPGGQAPAFSGQPDTRLLDNSVYGNTIIPYEFMRFFFTTAGSNWIDMKITKVVVTVRSAGGKGAPTLEILTIEGILLDDSNFDDIILGEDVRWNFYTQKLDDLRSPNELHAGDITPDSTTFSWKDSTKNLALHHQVKYRKWDGMEGPWTKSLIGGWITGVNVKLEGGRWPYPTETYLGKNVYWMEFSSPELSVGTKAKGWIEIINGNFGESFIIDKGSGYRFTPSIKLYYRELSANTLNNMKFERFSINELRIHETGHPFVNGDKVYMEIKNYPSIDGIYNVINATANDFEIIINDKLKVLPAPSGVQYTVKGKIELAPIDLPPVPGEIIPHLDKDKYYITGLDASSNYSISAISYFSDNLKDYTDYSKPINFTTR